MIEKLPTLHHVITFLLLEMANVYTSQRLLHLAASFYLNRYPKYQLKKPLYESDHLISSRLSIMQTMIVSPIHDTHTY
jgi:hypothetical protein